MTTTAADWFNDEYKFRQLCLDARSRAFTESALDFAHEMSVRANNRGLQTPITADQMRWLCPLAKWAMPGMRAPLKDDGT